MKYIKRHMEEIVLSLSKSWPVILLTGPRQAGKTTMLKQLAVREGTGREYVSLDDLNMREMAKTDPKMFLQLHKPPVLIDEVQYAPELFTYIKIHVDDHHNPGDFWLTGSQVFQLMHLYIDKAMHDHGLFQAICRVNRLDGESKDFGYIVDYKQLFGDLTDALNKYTSGAFEDYDAEDVEGLLKDRTQEARKFFDTTLDELDELCEGVEPPKAELDYIHYFCGENGIDADNDEAYARSREKLYRLVAKLLRAYAAIKPCMNEAGYTAIDSGRLETRVNFYLALRETIGRASGDFIDLKQFEPGMRYLIDNYIAAEDVEKIGMFDDFTLLDFILAQDAKLGGEDSSAKESAAEAIENNIRKKVVERIVINPAYYAKMSEVLEQLILDRKRGVVAYKQLIEKYLALAKNVTNPEDNKKYPDSIKGSGATRALYDNCGEDETLALKLHNAVLGSKMDGFRNNPVKENRIKKALYKILNDDEEVERLYKIVVEQEEY